jgi:DNA repair exonuclease SbcCD nuclease subunit
MTEFTFITANDIHISDKPPRSRIDDFRETVLGKIHQAGIACNKLKADAMLLAGDLFNIKDPPKNSHCLNQNLIREFKQFNCPIYSIEGNHDLVANQLDSISEQPLGVLYEDKTLIKLREHTIEKNGYKVSLIGIPYIDELDLSTVQIPAKGDCTTQICLLHLYAGLKGGMLYKERLYGYDELEKLSPDIFVIGHYHIDQGVYEQNGKHFVNIGSLTRGTLSEEDLAHRPQIGFIRITIDDHGNPSYTVKTIALKIKPAAEVFDLDKKKEEIKEDKEMKDFIDKLSSEVVNNTKDEVKDIDELISKMDMAKEVKNRVLSLIQKAVSMKTLKATK